VVWQLFSTHTASLVDLFCSLAERHHTDAVVLGGLADEFEQLREMLEGETRKRHEQVTLLNATMQAFADQVDGHNIDKRQLSIERHCGSVAVRTKVSCMRECFGSWSAHLLYRRRLIATQHRAICRMEYGKTRALWDAWLQASRAAQAARQSDLLAKLEYRSLRQDEGVEQHELHVANMISSMVEQLDIFRDEVDATVNQLQAAETNFTATAKRLNGSIAKRLDICRTEFSAQMVVTVEKVQAAESKFSDDLNAVADQMTALKSDISEFTGMHTNRLDHICTQHDSKFDKLDLSLQNLDPRFTGLETSVTDAGAFLPIHVIKLVLCSVQHEP
jgi:hypothetical protein